jgi:surface antigen
MVMLKKWTLISCASTVLVVSACTNVPTQEEQGVLIGALAGGILGYQVGDGSGQVIATMLGTVAGAMIGGNIGRHMDEQDQMKTALALENVRTGVPATWVNPDTGYEYAVTPTSTYESNSGPCREYTVDATIGGKTEQVYGTACRQADGSWQVQN